MQNLAASKANFLAAQQFCQLGAMSSTPTSSSLVLIDSNSSQSNKMNGNGTLATSANLLDNYTMEQLENFQQLLATLDPVCFLIIQILNYYTFFLFV